ncbi:hypothetical protein WISP_27827 [Willisornis vidua]|uniref:Uncharacterized protein n=1 Tax=Willisornis vidua TaxID=1566151 RepID=A0ABQ9DSF5_9PASS|nr:hypothetical protein WISP_27827 [Willisornis vidua]
MDSNENPGHACWNPGLCPVNMQQWDLQLGEERHNKNQSLEYEAKNERKKSQIEAETNPTFFNSKGIDQWNKTVNGKEEL